MYGLISRGLALSETELNMEASTLLMDVLQYVHAKHFGGNNATEHHERRERIRLNVQILKLTRAVIGKTPYESMKWKAVTTITKRVKNIEQDARRSGLWSQQ